MPSTYSPNLRIELIANGEQSGTWGTTTNTNLGTLIEDAISGYVSVSITSANQALTAVDGGADQSRNMVINLTTTTSAVFNVYIPPAEKFYVIRNSSAYDATIYCSTVLGNTTAAGTGVTVLAGTTTMVFADGTNVASSLTAFSGNLVVSANSSSPALRVTQTGSGNAILVEDSANPDATPFVVTATGDVGIGTTTPTNLLSVAGNANITGNTTLGDASTDTVTVNGYMGVGGAANSNYAINIVNTALTGGSQYGVVSNPTFTSAATSNATAIAAIPATAVSAATHVQVHGIRLFDATKGAGSTITNQHGVFINNQTQGTNNFGITSEVSSGTNKWNIYASGTAANYFAGTTLIGTTASNGVGGGSGSGTLQVETANAASNISVARNTNNSTPPYFFFGKSRGAALGGRTIVASGDILGQMIFSGTDGTDYIQAASIFSAVDGTPGTNDMPGRLVFSTTADGASSPTERMRLDSAGNLGLGVTPSAWTTYKAIQLGATTPFAIDSSGAIGLNYYYDGAYKYFGTSAATLYSTAAGQHRWYNAPSGTAGNAITFTQAMTLDADGDLGIGTSSPVSKLHVSYASSGLAPRIAGTTSGRVDLEDLAVADGSRPFQYLESDGGALIFGNANRSGTSTTSSVERMRIDSAGNINIATTGARITGDFSNATVANRVMFQTSTTNGGTSIAALPNGTGVTASVLAFGGSDPANAPFTGFNNTATESQVLASKIGTGSYLPMTFYTGGSERMRLDTSGNVGIGTSSPSGRLHVESSSGGLPLYVNTTASAQNARIRLNSTDNASSVSYVLSYSHASLNKQAAMLLGGTGSIGFYVNQTAGAEPTTGTLAATFDSSGNVGIGTSSPACKTEVAGTIRTTAATAPASGAGVEVLYGAVANRGDVISYDRGASAYKDLLVGGLNMYLYAGGSERARIDSSGFTQFSSNNVMPYQGAPTSKAAAATLTGAELITGILNTTGTTYTITLPTGTNIEGALTWSANNVCLDWFVINTASGTITIGANGNTTLGSLTIATGTSAQFRIRRTAANTFTVYRL